MIFIFFKKSSMIYIRDRGFVSSIRGDMVKGHMYHLIGSYLPNSKSFAKRKSFYHDYKRAIIFFFLQCRNHW